MSYDGKPPFGIREVKAVPGGFRVDYFGTINARTDVDLNQEGKSETWVEETISRAAVYQAAGADGLFVPGITEASSIKAVAEGIKLPLNVMACPGLPAAKELTKLGVRRLSAGAAISQVIWNHAFDLAKGFLQSGDSHVVVTNGMPYSKLQGMFTR